MIKFNVPQSHITLNVINWLEKLLDFCQFFGPDKNESMLPSSGQQKENQRSHEEEKEGESGLHVLVCSLYELMFIKLYLISADTSYETVVMRRGQIWVSLLDILWIMMFWWFVARKEGHTFIFILFHTVE